MDIGGIPLAFILFALTLIGVAWFHRHTLTVALTGLAVVTLYSLLFTGFAGGTGVPGLMALLAHEWVTLANLLGLLLGFALLSRHFEQSHLPDKLPAILPHDWKGGLVLLAVVFVLSSFLDNIAAALIGGTMARAVFRGKVHIAYLVAIVAAANGGGSGSVVGDTTTTMMWIDGVSPVQVLHAFLPSAVALLVFGIPAALAQQKHSPIYKHNQAEVQVDWLRVLVVVVTLVAVIATNILVNLLAPQWNEHVPVIGLVVLLTLLLCAPLRRPDWSLLPEAAKGAAFLLALVLMAAMMPVERLPAPSAASVFGLGFISAVFDNIPLTALALRQGGYDWGFLAYAVGFGGSMIWFGSSAGVALVNQFPEARSVSLWLRHGWTVVLAYMLGFAVLWAVLGWHPELKQLKTTARTDAVVAADSNASWAGQPHAVK